jgi:hypothetical protein
MQRLALAPGLGAYRPAGTERVFTYAIGDARSRSAALHAAAAAGHLMGGATHASGNPPPLTREQEKSLMNVYYRKKNYFGRDKLYKLVANSPP